MFAYFQVYFEWTGLMQSLKDDNAKRAMKFLFEKFENGDIYSYMYSYDTTEQKYVFVKTGLPVPLYKLQKCEQE